MTSALRPNKRIRVGHAICYHDGNPKKKRARCLKEKVMYHDRIFPGLSRRAELKIVKNALARDGKIVGQIRMFS